MRSFDSKEKKVTWSNSISKISGKNLYENRVQTIVINGGKHLWKHQTTQRYKGGFIPDTARSRGEDSSSKPHNKTPRRRNPEIVWKGESGRKKACLIPAATRKNIDNHLRALDNPFIAIKPTTNRCQRIKPEQEVPWIFKSSA